MGSPGGKRAEELRVLLAASAGDSALSLQEDLAQTGFSVCMTAHDASGAVAGALLETPDLCVLAAELPGSAVLATAEITHLLPQTPVVIVAPGPDESDCLTYLLAGASAYLQRDMGREALAVSLRLAVAGQSVLPAGAERRLLDELRMDPH
jgi:DNA-binding NarL/FixJ family response regulator